MMLWWDLWFSQTGSQFFWLTLICMNWTTPCLMWVTCTYYYNFLSANCLLLCLKTCLKWYLNLNNSVVLSTPSVHLSEVFKGFWQLICTFSCHSRVSFALKSWKLNRLNLKLNRLNLKLNRLNQERHCKVWTPLKILLLCKLFWLFFLNYK